MIRDCASNYVFCVQVCMRIDFAEKTKIVMKLVTVSQGSE